MRNKVTVGIEAPTLPRVGSLEVGQMFRFPAYQHDGNVYMVTDVIGPDHIVKAILLASGRIYNIEEIKVAEPIKQVNIFRESA